MALIWKKGSTGSITGTDWSRWLDELRRVDPYLVWADLSCFAGLGGFSTSDDQDPSGGKLPVLIEAVKPPIFDGTGKPCVFAEMEIPGIYHTADGLRDPALFFTARISPGSVESLLTCPETIRRFQLGLPRIPDTDTRPLEVFFDPAAGEPQRPEVVIGVIDDGCALDHPQFMHQGPGDAFRTQGSSRVRYLWDQSWVPSRARARSDQENRVPTERGLGYGQETTPTKMDAAFKASQAGRSANGGDGLYGQLDYVRAQAHQYMHGTGVLDLAAGHIAPVPLDRRRDGSPAPADAPLDLAGEAPLIFVQLPVRSVLDTSGGSLGVHLLDGIKYVLSRADAMFKFSGGGKTMSTLETDQTADSTGTKYAKRLLVSKISPPRVVLTVSFGSIGGPHDGSSMIEQAMDELVRREQRMALVVAAGNAHGSRTHAAMALKPENQTRRMPANVTKGQRALPELDPGTYQDIDWQIAADNPHESYLEIWLDKDDERGVLVTLQPPGESSPQMLQAGQGWLLHDERATEVPVAGAIYARRVAQGLNGTMVLLAVGPTRPYNPRAGESELEPPFGRDRPFRPGVPRATAPAGNWLVSVHNTLSTPVAVHLWTERNDLVGAKRRRQQSRLSDHGTRAVQADHSLGTLANGTQSAAGSGRVLVVGGYRLSDGKMAPYSSGGPARAPSTRSGPDIEAPSDMALSMPGLRVAGTRHGASARLGGTSAAAPLVARWIANQKWKNQEQLADVLKSLPAVVPDRLLDSPPWPDPLPEGHDDANRHGKRRL